MSGDSLAAAMRPSIDQPISVLARNIVGRRIVSFPSGIATQVPCFQFDMRRWEVLHGVSSALSELTEAFDDWATAEWFVRPNCWIQCRIPCLLVTCDPKAVVDAARADRHIAAGW